VLKHVHFGDNTDVVEIEAVETIRQRLAAYEPRLLPETGGKRAAVLVPLYQHRDELHVVFTKRTDLVQSHKGEISFPGGARDPEDTDLIATAMREAEEEIGLLAEHIELIGQLDDIVTISDYHVSVYVGRLHSHPAPYVWQPQAAEVAEVLEVPLSHLRSVECLVEVPRQRNGALEIMEGFLWHDHIIWGATGRMLRNFLNVTETLSSVLPGRTDREAQG
jgi:8-oxo-dGTP pyrophosphatase MutT (NUDIX family)